MDYTCIGLLVVTSVLTPDGFLCIHPVSEWIKIHPPKSDNLPLYYPLLITVLGSYGVPPCKIHNWFEAWKGNAKRMFFGLGESFNLNDMKGNEMNNEKEMEGKNMNGQLGNERVQVVFETQGRPKLDHFIYNPLYKSLLNIVTGGLCTNHIQCAVPCMAWNKDEQISFIEGRTKVSLAVSRQDLVVPVGWLWGWLNYRIDIEKLLPYESEHPTLVCFNAIRSKHCNGSLFGSKVNCDVKNVDMTLARLVSSSTFETRSLADDWMTREKNTPSLTWVAAPFRFQEWWRLYSTRPSSPIPSLVICHRKTTLPFMTTSIRSLSMLVAAGSLLIASSIPGGLPILLMQMLCFQEADCLLSLRSPEMNIDLWEMCEHDLLGSPVWSVRMQTPMSCHAMASNMASISTVPIWVLQPADVQRCFFREELIYIYIYIGIYYSGT